MMISQGAKELDSEPVELISLLTTVYFEPNHEIIYKTIYRLIRTADYLIMDTVRVVLDARLDVQAAKRGNKHIVEFVDPSTDSISILDLLYRQRLNSREMATNPSI